MAELLPIERAPIEFSRLVATTPDITNATARLGLWFIGSALVTGEYPLELSLRDFSIGFSRSHIVVPGTGCRIETVKSALKRLEDEGFLKSREGKYSGFGHHSRVYWMER